MGQGLYTKMQGVAMRELGLPADAIRVMQTQTDKVPEHVGDRGVERLRPQRRGGARRRAMTLRERLAPVAARAARAPSRR